MEGSVHNPYSFLGDEENEMKFDKGVERVYLPKDGITSQGKRTPLGLRCVVESWNFGVLSLSNPPGY